VTNGQREFQAIAIVASGRAPHTPKGELSCTPCGACRQVLSEFGDRIVVILERDDGSPWEMALSELLPYQFVLKVD
jgi:cytidine deaminase